MERIDFPGAFHYVIGRGMEGRPIFCNDVDRVEFLKKLERVLIKTETTCYAWALIPNHFHLFLRTAQTPISRVMASLLTRYVLYFNKHHQRSGSLFQNRFKSILCQEENYFLPLLRYIHLSPLKAGQVETLFGLEQYPWCGHGALLAQQALYAWQSTQKVLEMFRECGPDLKEEYRRFMAKDVGANIPGPFLICSRDGKWKSAPVNLFLSPDGAKEGILGSQDWVNQVLLANQQEKHPKDRNELTETRITIALQKAASVAGITKEEIPGSGKTPSQCLARSIAIKWFIDDLGLSGTCAAQILKIHPAAASKILRRGRNWLRDHSLTLEPAQS